MKQTKIMNSKKYVLPEDEPQILEEPSVDYHTAMAIPVPGQITVNIEDISMLKE